MSQDSGETWSKFRSKFRPMSDDHFTIDTIRCANNQCVVMGNYSDNDDLSHPLLLVSEDKGSSWSFVENFLDFPRRAHEVKFTSGFIK